MAVVCDGAGSAKRSEKGSEFVAKRAIPNIFKPIIEKRGWKKANTLPSEADWKLIAKEGFEKVTEALLTIATQQKVVAKELACTAILVISTPKGILAAHIGDGRAAYCNDKNEWKALIKPFKGEEANQTVFVTSGWEKDPITYFESHVIEDNILAYTLMSDGCEATAFHCSYIDPKTKMWSDPNEPSVSFYNNVSKQIAEDLKQGKKVEEINKDWTLFLEKGLQGFRDEQDDKTMIFAIAVDK